MAAILRRQGFYVKNFCVRVWTVPEPLTRRTGADAVEAAAALADPLRRRLHQLLLDSEEPVGRDDAAAALGISRSLAGYHLDQLAEDGLVVVSYARRSGRTGPGAGRPAKLYVAAPVEVSVQLPPRDDALVAHLLASAVEADASGAARQALRAVTRTAGRALGEAIAGRPEDPDAAVAAVLEERGYAPAVDADGIRLRNCPFHHLVDDHLELVCSLNEDLLGSACRAAALDLSAELDPQPGRCCVVLRRPG
jgi:predicted ArsR family transcriptional regulator